MRYHEFITEAPKRDLSPAFKAWFGNSKVINGQGEPLVLYHGTGAAIESFRGMVWASNTPGLANDYADFRGLSDLQPNIVPLFMRMEKPFHADLGLASTVKIGEFFDAVLEQAIDAGFQIGEANRKIIQRLLDLIRTAAQREESGPHYGRHDFWNDASSMFGSDGAAAILQVFKVLGFDGIQMIENGVLTFGAFRSDQVKSVFNKGLYNANDARISESDSA